MFETRMVNIGDRKYGIVFFLIPIVIVIGLIMDIQSLCLTELNVFTA
jgi:hypothetical protein